MPKYRHLQLVVFIIGSLVLHTMVGAATTYRVQGTVLRVEGFLTSPFSIGQSFTAEFSIDDTATDMFPDDPTLGFYRNAIPHYSVDIGGGAYVFSETDGGLAVRDNNTLSGPPIDYVEVFAQNPPSAPPVDGKELDVLSMLRLIDESASIFPTDAIPSSIPALPHFDLTDFTLQFIDPDDPAGVPGEAFGAIEIISKIICDFDFDDLCNLSDIDLMLAEGPIASGVAAVALVNDQFDLNADGVINRDDRDIWLSQAALANGFSAAYNLGDANLDGVVDVSDFNTWNASKFSATLRWSEGDFNADGVADISDFNSWNQNKFTSSDTFQVPEPHLTPLFAVLAGLFFWHRRRQ